MVAVCAAPAGANRDSGGNKPLPGIVLLWREQAQTSTKGVSAARVPAKAVACPQCGGDMATYGEVFCCNGCSKTYQKKEIT